jgi:protein-L-isoaspartate(D-aspartate) O-methyltransferase
MSVSLEDYRRFYAEEIACVAALRSRALVEALAKVPREKFLGPGPWQIGSFELMAAREMKAARVQHRQTEDADPRRVYHNIVVVIDPARNLNNGHPATLASWLDALEITPGERVFHMGAGLGYFSAILGEMTGPEGRVTAVEVDTDLAGRARANLARWPNVKLHSGDGNELDPGPVDVVFINAGVTHPRALWLDRLAEGGRLLVPLTFDVGGGIGKGVMMLVKRKADNYSARLVSLVMIYSSTSGRDEETNAALAKQIGSPKLFSVQSLRRDEHEAEETCWFHGTDFCFSQRALE